MSAAGHHEPELSAFGGSAAWLIAVFQAGEAFPVGGSKVLRAASGDEVALTGAGVTAHQCLRAAGDLAADGCRLAVARDLLND